MANELTVQKYIKNPGIQKTIEDRLKNRAGQFTTSLLSVINNNSLIGECVPETVLNAAMTAASLDLPINQNLGFAYIIPYKNKGVYEAQFQLGVKGFIQLAQRSRQYKTISASAVYEGQLLTNDPLRGIVFDWSVEAKGEPIGYAAFFELLNGFEKTLYMTMNEIKKHAKRYSQSFKSNYGPWADNFDAMAQKTVIKLLLSKFGPLSTELQTALETDQSVDDGKDRKYIDNDDLSNVEADDEKKAAIIAANKPEESEEEVADRVKETFKPKKTVKEKADEWAKKGKAANHKGEQGTLIDDNNTPSPAGN